MDVVVGVNLHQKSMLDVAVQPSNGKVRIIFNPFDTRRVLKDACKSQRVIHGV